MKQDKQARKSRSAHGNGYVLSRDLTPQLVPVAGCKPLGRESRKHPPQQVRKLAASLERFGFVLPILIDPEGRVVAGWGLVLAARQLGLGEVPAVSLTDLSEAELRVLRLALNRITDDAAWDREALALEFSELWRLHRRSISSSVASRWARSTFCWTATASSKKTNCSRSTLAAAPVSRAGDLWILGEHRLLCGDALYAESYAHVLGADKAQMMFADPPYNVPIAGHASGLGAVKHADFVMASGELSAAEFQIFFDEPPLAMRRASRSTAPSISFAWIGATSGSSLPPAKKFTANSKSLRMEQEQRRDGLALPLKA